MPIKSPMLGPSVSGAPSEISELLESLPQAQIVENGLWFSPPVLEREELRAEEVQTKASWMVRGKGCLSQDRNPLIYFTQQNAG